MKAEKLDPQRYWEAKIQNWDANRHGGNESALSWIDRVTQQPMEAIKFRYEVALDHLSRHAKGKRVVELGCGIGRLSQPIIEAGAASYHGIDIAANAIEQATTENNLDHVTYEHADISNLKAIEADIVLSIGFLSWLNIDQVDHIFTISGPADFVHTITERKLSARHFLKWCKQITTGGHKYKVNYMKTNMIEGMARKNGHNTLHVYKNPKLYANIFVSSLPFNKD